MNNELRIGIVGCGNIALTQLKYVTKYVGKDAVALCDRNQLRMDFLSNKFHISNTYADLQTMLEQFKPTIVHILTPPHTHKDIAIICLETGCNIFIEKPMCLSLKDAVEVFELANKKGLSVCVDHMRLYDPLIIQVKALLDTGAFGEIVHLAFNESDNYLDRKKLGLAPKWLTELPGETIYDLLPHHLSLLQMFLLEAEIKGVTCQFDENASLSDLRCLFSAVTGTATIQISLKTFPIQNQITVECTNGLINVDFRNLTITTKCQSGLPDVVERVFDNFRVSKQMIQGTFTNIYQYARGRLDTYKGMDNAISSFYQSIKENIRPPITKDNCLFVMAQLDKIEEQINQAGQSAKVNIPINLPPIREEFRADVLVTGGTGFIGKHLVNRLVSQGNRVRVITHREVSRIGHPFDEDRVQLVVADIANPSAVNKACEGVREVYHLAAATSGNWFYHLDATVSGTQNILDACLANNVVHLVYMSTISLLNATEYPKNGTIDEKFSYEEHPEKRGNYPYAKLLAEKIILDYMNNSTGLTISVMRPGLVYGPGKDLLSDVATKRFKDTVIVFGSADRLLPLIFVDNLTDALLLACKTRAVGIFNIMDKESISVKDVLNAYKATLNENLKTFFVPMPLLLTAAWLADRALSSGTGNSSVKYRIKTMNRSVRHSTDRIENTIGWTSKVPFVDGIERTIEATEL